MQREIGSKEDRKMKGFKMFIFLLIRTINAVFLLLLHLSTFPSMRTCTVGIFFYLCILAEM